MSEHAQFVPAAPQQRKPLHRVIGVSMVEYGIIKWFDGREGKLFGFADVLGTDGQVTGEIWFHLYDQRSAFDQQFRATTVPVLPDPGTRIVFERASGRIGRPKALPWAPEAKWLQRSWRLVQKVQIVTGIVEFAGTVDETYREEKGSIVILSGLTNDPDDEIERWKAAKLEFYHSEASMHEYGHETYVYYLQVLRDGKWHTVKGMSPIPDPPDCEYCNDYGCEYCDPLGFDSTPDPADDYYHARNDEEGDASPGEIYSRALRVAGGNHELAREMASQLPGDFM